MDGGAWWAAVHGVSKTQTLLSDFTFTFHFHALEKEMATHSSVLAWKISGMGEPGGLPSTGSHSVGHDWSDAAAAAAAVTIFPLPTHLRFPNVIIFISLTLQMCCRHLEEDATGSTFQGLKLGWGQAPERDYLCLFQKNFLVFGTLSTSTYLAIGPLQGSTNRGEKMIS